MPLYLSVGGVARGDQISSQPRDEYRCFSIHDESHPDKPITGRTCSRSRRHWTPLPYWTAQLSNTAHYREWVDCHVILWLIGSCSSLTLLRIAKRISYHRLLAWKGPKFKLWGVASTECALLLYHCKAKKSEVWNHLYIKPNSEITVIGTRGKSPLNEWKWGKVKLRPMITIRRRKPHKKCHS